MFYFSFDSQPFIAVIGDIVDSKKLQSRKDIQEKIKLLLSDINKEYSEDITSKFMVTLGDEFQGLLHTGTHAIEIIERIEREMFPVKIRFGIGVGAITTDIDPNLPLGADGPAYYNARKMIDELKLYEKKNMESKPNVKIELENNAGISELINVIFSLNTALKSKWTARQREIINTYINCGRTQSDVAAKLGINQSTVQRILSGSNFYTYQQSIDKITQVLSNIKEGNRV